MPDLFGHQTVSVLDVVAWTQAVPAYPHAPGSAHWVQYVRDWNVLDKVAHAKQAGTFDALAANCPHISDDDLRVAEVALKALVAARENPPARTTGPATSAPPKKRRAGTRRAPLLPSETFAPLSTESILPTPGKWSDAPTPTAAARSAAIISLPTPAKPSAATATPPEPLRTGKSAEAIDIAPHLSAKSAKTTSAAPTPAATRPAAKPDKMAASSR